MWFGEDKSCVACHIDLTITALIDYEAFCHGAPDLTAPVPEIDVHALERRMKSDRPFLLLDVREPFEFEMARIEGANLIPLGELPGRVGELDPEKEIFVFCHSGVRSGRAAEFLRSAGFSKVANVTGGIDAWSEEIDPDVPRY